MIFLSVWQVRNFFPGRLGISGVGSIVSKMDHMMEHTLATNEIGISFLRKNISSVWRAGQSLVDAPLIFLASLLRSYMVSVIEASELGQLS
ncbi:MAG TPA: hypothetical protein DIC56_16845 [Rhizobium sp.]|nr:hypothetical protein [Rhizobium sp.]